MNYNDFIKEVHNKIDNEIECNYIIDSSLDAVYERMSSFVRRWNNENH